MDKFTITGFLLRLLLALVLVLLTYNPSGYSYVHWVLVGWIVFIGATKRSIGSTGILLAAAVFAALLWLLVAQGWLELGSMRAIMWVSLVAISIILAIGMSWSHITRQLTGQTDVDEIDSR